VPSPKSTDIQPPRKHLPTLTLDLLAMNEFKSYIDAAYLGRWDAAPALACLSIHPFRSSGNGPLGTRIDPDDGIQADFALICIPFFGLVSAYAGHRCPWFGCLLRNAACFGLVRKCCRSIKGSVDVPFCRLYCSCIHYPASGE
jgi:hypothetical protein